MLAVLGQGCLMADGVAFAERFAARMAEVKADSIARVGHSPAERLAFAASKNPSMIDDVLTKLAPIDYQRTLFDWSFWARPKQIAPAEPFDVWMNLGGRGVGKTRGGSEWTIDRLTRGMAKEIAIIGPSFREVRKIQIGGYEKRAEGANGSSFLDCLPPWIRYELKEQKAEVLFPDLKARAYWISAEKPEFVGNNPDTVWADEVIAWPHPEKLLDHIFLSNRKKGRVRPQLMITTTPRPLQFLRDLIVEPGTATTHSTTWENRSNLAPSYLDRLRRTMAGTRQGLQELEAEILGDNPDALFAATTIDAHRVDDAPPLDRIAIAVDPAVSQHRKSDDTGIVGLGRAGDAHSGELFVLADRTGRLTPDGWGDAVFDLVEIHGASVIVAEKNRAGDLVSANLRAVAVRRGWRVEDRKGTVVFAKNGRSVELVLVLAMGDKATRAEPLSTLYEKGRVHHVGRLARLEDEMTEWNPRDGVSPNGLDALVHGATELLSLDRPLKNDPRVGFKGLREAIGAAERAGQPEQAPAKGPGSLRTILAQMGRRDSRI
jgi:phage terminase large subunit-like protein